MENEVWKVVEGFEDYEVSNHGRVKSLKFGREKILKTPKNNHGYNQVGLYKNDKKNLKIIHKLVAIAFLSHKPNGMKLVIDHINDIKTDNRVENLQIVTQRFNGHKTQGKYSSKYKGVSWNKVANKWQVSIRINNIKTYLGCFDNELEASEVYQLKLKTL